MVETKLAGGLITLVDGKPELGFHDIAAQAVGYVATDIWGYLLNRKACRLLLVDAIAKPSWAEGRWKQSTRTAQVRRMYASNGEPRANRVRYTVLHELAGHGSDSFGLDAKDRSAAMALMSPKPSSWADVDGAEGMRAYWRLPSESYANRLVEALVGKRVSSPYDDDYIRKIPDSSLAKLKDIAIRETAAPIPPAEEPIEEPPPTPLELELMQALEAANGRLAVYDAQTLKASEALWRPEWGVFPPPAQE